MVRAQFDCAEDVYLYVWEGEELSGVHVCGGSGLALLEARVEMMKCI